MSGSQGQRLQVAIAGFALESASFVPGETDTEVFERGALRGRELARLGGTNDTVGGFVSACDAAGVAWIGLVYAEAGAAGMASDAAFDAYLAEVLAGLAALEGRIDALALHLHGAMVTPSRPAADADFARAVRAALPAALPMALALDLHGNVGAQLVAATDIVCGYHESPHVDMGETGARAARLLIRTLRGEIHPRTVLARPGLALPSIFTATALQPLRGFVDETIAASTQRGATGAPLLDASLFTGFAYADAPDCGAAVVAVADGDAAPAQAFVDDLSARLRASRHALFKRELVYAVEPGVARAVRRAGDGDGPVVVLEHADRMNDSTWCLRELLRIGAERVAVPYLWDPAAAAAATAAGPGAELTLAVGGHSSPEAGGPVTIHATVKVAGPKRYVGTGPMRLGIEVDLGVCALVDTGTVLIWLTSQSLSAIDTDPFVQYGLDPKDFAIVLLRSKTHFRAGWASVASDIVIVDTPDWGPADLTRLPYRHLPTGVFPVTGN